MSLRCFPSSFGSIQLTVCEEMLFKEFQDGHHGGHLGYWNRTILEILNLYVTPMPPIKFRLNPTYGLFEEFQDGHHSNSESLCHCDASHQVWAQSNLLFRRRCHLKNFKMAGGHLGYRNEKILVILNLCVAQSV